MGKFRLFVLFLVPQLARSLSSHKTRIKHINMTNDKEREKAKQKNIAVIENAIAARNKVEKESWSLCFFLLGVFFRDIRARAQISSFLFLYVFQKFLSFSLFFSRRRHPPVAYALEQRNSVIERKELLTSSPSLFFVFHYFHAV